MPLRSVDPSNYQQQLDNKIARISHQFDEFGLPELEIFASAPLNFRMRAEFRIWHQGDDTHYVMFRKEDPKTPHNIEQFPIGSTTIQALMPQIMDRIKQQPILRDRLFQIEFLTTQTGEALVTLIYHKKLQDDWLISAKQLQEELAIAIIGRSKKQKCVLGKDSVIEQLNVNEQQFQFQQVETGFTQPNAGINEKMLAWALDNTVKSEGDLLELYCGNGNFTAVLAQHFRRVLATEISKTSVKSAQYNFTLNNVNNVDVLRMSSEEFSSALRGEREYRRLANIQLSDYDIKTVLVDPPRAGIDDDTLSLINQFQRIIYISCNPNTLYNNLQKLTRTHTVKAFALFDQFPYTDHIECGVILDAKENSQ